MSRWPATREQFEREADIAEAKYTPLVMGLVSAPEVIGLHRAIGKRIDALGEELREQATKTMQERSTSIGNKQFHEIRKGRG